jgi:hypothetical protein
MDIRGSRRTIEVIAFDTGQLSVGTMCLSDSVWGDELGRVSQFDVLGGEFDQVIARCLVGLASS